MSDHIKRDCGNCRWEDAVRIEGRYRHTCHYGQPVYANGVWEFPEVHEDKNWWCSKHRFWGEVKNA